MKILLYALSVAIAALAFGAAAPDSDAAARQKLAGIWTLTAGSGRYLATRTIEFKPDGTGAHETKAASGNPDGYFQFDFKWEIEAGILTHTITKTSNSNQFPVGKKISWEIIEITADKFTHRPHPIVGDGKATTTDFRAKPPAGKK